jgi:short-subunit dehydrogenase
MLLADRIVVITGASAGIGAATARAASARGATTVLVARTEAKLRELAAELPRAHAFAADASDEAAVARLCEQVMATVGKPDVIVNNAGAGRFLRLEETSPAEFLEMTSAPYLAAAFVTRAFLPAMIERDSGWIVNVNSPISRMTWPGAAGYAGGRWALRGFTEALRMDLRGSGIGVSEVIPGKVSSEYFEHNPGAEERIPDIAKLLRTLTPAQAAEGILRAIEREQRELVLPAELHYLLKITAHLPRFTQWLMWRTGARRT